MLRYSAMPVHLIYGDSAPEIDDALRAARQPFDSADVLSFDGREVALHTLSEASLTAGLFATDRLVIVHGLHERIKGKKDEDLDGIRAILNAVPETTTLLLVERDMPAEHALQHAVREVRGKVSAFTTPRKQDVPRWIATRAKLRGIAIQPGAVELLADLVGANTLLLDSELSKLATYAGDEAITPEMVQELVGAIPQDSIFALVDAVAAGNRAQALELIHAQLYLSSANPMEFALVLIRMIARQMRILLRIKLGTQAGRSQSQITADVKLPRYFAGRYFQQARRLSPERITRAFEHLAALEYALKSSKMEPGPGLDLLIADLCQ